jgi:hypothetical protein
VASVRFFKRGASIDLFVKLTVPGSLNEPGTAMRVYLRSLVRTDGLPVVMPTNADLQPSGNAGEFYLRLDSSPLVPGTYRYQIAALGSDQGVAYAEDTFVVVA